MSKPFTPEITVDELNGTSIGEQFLFLSPIGDGGQGTVFKAVLSHDSQEIAVKVYSPDQLIKRAELEVAKLEKTKSPHLARLVDHGSLALRGRECFFVATEYVPGTDLKKYLEKATLSQSEAAKLLKQMLFAIEEMWELRIVHCDIKPANIMCSISGEFQLIDLGLAKHLDTQTITMAGMIMGTLGYMAPEQLRGRKNFTLRVDLFALGIVVYEALAGVHPFHKNQFHIGNMEPLPLSEFVEVDSRLEQALRWMLQANPVRRPSSCKQILSLIEEVI
ncbi:serine/threonine-protein kinase [Paenibacillus sp. DCT19]|uniref:serine/threonine protein kinase n=1 Tax=Paenibacillus sp. DCT19 TaxID=2211212 RepID=UPI000FE26D66|nr:serine/threonine-protein kinase [Paenibacillus sp. DCT19]